MRSRVLLGVVALLSVASCMDNQDVVVDSYWTPLSADSDATGLPLCHWIYGRVRNREATVYPVKEHADLLAMDIEGDIVCVDTATNAYELGIVAIPPIIEPQCAICDGTPLPAEVFNLAAKNHALERLQR